MRITLLLIASFLLSACAAGGSSFTRPGAGPADKALIYFYRPKSMVAWAAKPMIVDNGTQTQRLANGQFVRYEATPGLHKFHTDTMAIDQPTVFEVEAGQTYYVRLSLRQGMWTGTWFLSRVFPDEALPEMMDCCKDGE